MEPITTAVAKTIGKEAANILQKESDGFIRAVLREPAKSLGGLLAANINKRLHANLIKATVEAKRRLGSAGVSPQEVPLSIIHPALQAASIEENPELQIVWANLLANAADPRQIIPVYPSFTIILKELTGREVKFLDALYDHASVPRIGVTDIRRIEYSEDDLLDIYAKAGLSRQKKVVGLSVKYWKENQAELEADVREFKFTLGIALRQSILRESVKPMPLNLPSNLKHRYAQTIELKLENSYALTSVGISFVAACRAPTK